MKKLLCIAHRGASGHEPENTLSAIETAQVLGADWIEVDVYAVERQLLVIHDLHLERTTNGMGIVTKQPLSYLRSLDAGNGQRIPFLWEVFALVDKRMGINVELKDEKAVGPVVSLIDESVKHCGWSYEQFIVSSFHHEWLVKIKGLQLKIPIGVLVDRPVSDMGFIEDLGAYSIHFRLEGINRALVCGVHERGCKVFVFTVNNLKDIKRMSVMGVDGVFTDYPDRVAAFQKGKSNEKQT